eukprot:scaffold30128_cov154-Skeletonema_menzelii.AAC.3
MVKLGPIFHSLSLKKKKVKEKHYSASHELLFDEGDKNTFKKLIDSGELVIGVHEQSVHNATDVVAELNNLRTSGYMWYFANNSTKTARRSPIACGPYARPASRNLEILKIQAPTLHNFVNYVADAYSDTGKTLVG